MQQSMGRRGVLAGMLAVVALVTGLSSGQVASAQYLSLFDDAPYAEWTGAEEAVHRLYQGAPSVNMHGLVVQFDSELNAERGRSTIDAWFLDAFATAGTPLAFQPVDAMGTMFVAQSYIATLDLGPGTDPYAGAALIVAQDETYVYVVAVIQQYQADTPELNGIALEAAKAMVDAMAATPTGLATPAATADEAPVSGLWAKLPVQADETPQRYGITYTEDTIYLEPVAASVALPPGVAATYGTGAGLTTVVARGYGVLDDATGQPQEVPAAYVEVAAYDDPANATAGFAVAGTAQLAELDLADVGLKSTTPDVQADEALAYAGQPQFEGEQYSIAMVVARSGTYVVTVVIFFSGDEDALAAAGALTQAVLDAGVTDSIESFDADGLSTGGLWDTLPVAGVDVLRGMAPIGDEVYFPDPDASS